MNILAQPSFIARRALKTGLSLLVLLCASTGFSQTYTTRFQEVENPLTEGGRWTNGGVDWTTIQKTNGRASGTQTGTNTGKFKFDDSYAHLSGFPPDQEAWGEASMVGNVITVQINGVEKARVTDDTFKTGDPGIGEFLACEGGRRVGSNPDHGLASFTARGIGATNSSCFTIGTSQNVSAARPF